MGFWKSLVGLMGTPKYDLTTIEGIRAIPVPTQKETKMHDVKEGLEYKLQRLATQYKKDGKMDLAIECLRKSNQLMPYSIFEYQKRDYERLYKFLLQAGRIEEAKVEKDKIEKMFGDSPIQKSTQERIYKGVFKDCQEYGTDLVEMSEHYPTCGECAKYQGRVFSISGVSKVYPPLPDVLKKGRVHNDCRHILHPFFAGVSVANHKNIIEYSNRPFEDNRSEEEKQQYDLWKNNKKQEKKDRSDYEWIVVNLSDIAPKSFGGYRKMKNANSKNYNKIVEAARQKGKNI